MADIFQIVIQKGPNPGRVIDLIDDEITMGREASNALHIDDRALSRAHARLVRTSSDPGGRGHHSPARSALAAGAAGLLFESAKGA